MVHRIAVSDRTHTLTLATLRGIGVTLNPKGGGQNLPFKKHRLYELAQMFSMVDLFFSI